MDSTSSLRLGDDAVAAHRLVRRSTEALARDFAATGELNAASAIRTEARVGHIENKPVARLVVFLRGTGCEWMERGGGCTMCGFFKATAGRLISAEEHMEQLRAALKPLKQRTFPIICLYNDGSLLNEQEVPRPALFAMARYVASLAGTRRVVVESRAEFITREVVTELKKVLGPVELEIAIGLETANDSVRHLCINKGLALTGFEKAVERAASAGCRIRPLLLVKPPFLTESEAIHDVVATIDYLSELGVPAADLEAMTIEEGTLVHRLWQAGRYELPWLWSIVEILESTGPDYPVYVSPFSYSVGALDAPKNCPACTAETLETIFGSYNRFFDRSSLASLDCECRIDWERSKLRRDSRPLDRRVLDELALFSHAQSYSAMALHTHD
jgi:radical SAM enzyme (TIGR01210 family)